MADSKATTETKKPWGRLVSLTPQRCATIELVENRVVVGRSHLVEPSKEISSSHFTIWREEGPDGSLVLIKDSSTNGTFLNGERLKRDVQKIIDHGSDVSMLDPKRQGVDNILFTFIDVAAEQAESEEGGPQSLYDFQQVLGTGNFAVVRLVTERSTGTKYAMKVIEKRNATSSKRPEAIMDEIKILQAVSHPNIISVHQVFHTTKRIFLVLELVTGGELFDAIITEGKFTEERSRNIARQMFDAIKYLHAQGISHRDLKPENILLAAKDSNTIKISDFGLSRVIDEGKFMQTMCGTPQYVAPEVLSGIGYSPAVDLWSAGVIIFAMLCGSQPFDDSEGNNKMFARIQKAQYTFFSPQWDTISDNVKDLIRKLLVVDPKMRLTAEQCLDHPWFKADLTTAPTEKVTVASAEAAPAQPAPEAKQAAGANVAEDKAEKKEEKQDSEAKESKEEDKADKKEEPAKENNRESEAPAEQKAAGDQQRAEDKPPAAESTTKGNKTPRKSAKRKLGEETPRRVMPARSAKKPRNQ
eukprot:m51a1_g8075 FHA domain-containing protein (528) ;mRNA; r:186748-188806